LFPVESARPPSRDSMLPNGQRDIGLPTSANPDHHSTLMVIPWFHYPYFIAIRC
jgi:hypothetical protein